MARPRTPAAKARATGADVKHKDRFDGRNEPIVLDGVGDPPANMTKEQKECWVRMASDIPWLYRPHRYLLGMAVRIQTRIEAGDEVGVQAMNLLRQALGQMGATPADASKVGAMPDGQSKDPAEDYFD